MSAAPEAIDEGESATLTVAISNGVTFAEDQTLSLTASGTASAADYTGVPATLTLVAGASSVIAELAATDDLEEEEPETVEVAVSHGGVAIGAATLTIRSVSHDATLSALSLSGIDIGAFSSETDGLCGGRGASLGEHDGDGDGEPCGGRGGGRPRDRGEPGGGRERDHGHSDGRGRDHDEDLHGDSDAGERAAGVGRARFERGDGRHGGGIRAEAGGGGRGGADRVGNGGRDRLDAVRGGAGFGDVRARGNEATLSVPTEADTVVEADSTLTVTVTEGTAYTVGSAAVASVTVEDDDAAEFTVSATPEAIDEGESATLTVAISNGVTFAEDQAVSLRHSGTASPADYTGVLGVADPGGGGFLGHRGAGGRGRPGGGRARDGDRGGLARGRRDRLGDSDDPVGLA